MQGFTGTSTPGALTGVGAPVVTPQFVGQQYVDTASGNIYTAVGTSGAYNWGFTGRGLTSAFNKDTIPGLRGWFDASNATNFIKDGGNAVSTWYDLSDTGYNLSYTGTNKAIYTTNRQNGLSGLVFTAANSVYLGSTVTNLLSSPQATIFVVYKSTQTSGSCPILTNYSDACGIYHRAANNSNTLGYCGNSQVGNISFVANTTRLLTMVQNGSSTGSFQVNQNSPATGAMGTNYFDRLQLANNNAGAWFDGDLYEILIYQGVLSTNNISLTQTMLNNKWAVY